MADKFEDPTDPSDPSVTPDSSGASDPGPGPGGPEPSGEELISSGDNTGASHPEVREGGLTPVSEEQVADIVGDDSLDLDAESDAEHGDTERTPEPAAVGSSALGAKRPVRKSAVNAEAETVEPTKRRTKQSSTPKQRREDEEEPRTSPPEFVRQSVGELRKVVWPTGEQVRGYFVVVLVFVLSIIAFVSVLDLVFGWALLQVFG